MTSLLKHRIKNNSVTTLLASQKLTFMAKELYWIVSDCRGLPFKVATECKLLMLAGT